MTSSQNFARARRCQLQIRSRRKRRPKNKNSSPETNFRNGYRRLISANSDRRRSMNRPQESTNERISALVRRRLQVTRMRPFGWTVKCIWRWRGRRWTSIQSSPYLTTSALVVARFIVAVPFPQSFKSQKGCPAAQRTSIAILSPLC